MPRPTPKTRTPEPPDAAAARKAALRLTLGYAVAATLWILLSDELLGLLNLPLGATVAISQVKGFLFVIVTAAIVFFVSSDALATIRTANNRYHQLFANATEGLTLYSVVRDEKGVAVDLIVEDVNDARTTISGVRREQLLGKSVKVTAQLDPEIKRLADTVWEAVREGSARAVEMHDETQDLYWVETVYPVDEDLWALALVDVTDERKAEKALRDQEETIRRTYVDVLDAVTGGKLILMTEHEIAAELGEPLSAPERISSAAQVASARAHIRGKIHDRLPGSQVGHDLMTPVGEALNNVINHAGRGTYQVFGKPDGTIQVRVADSGPGIDFRNLPKATLVQGYSTTATLGAGFTLMLRMSGRVLLATRPGRTIVVLECRDTKSSPPASS
jgi:anti-sigma regulatory factor (Ser/Thr protein kinase)/PAS domain-containing protein